MVNWESKSTFHSHGFETQTIWISHYSTKYDIPYICKYHIYSNKKTINKLLLTINLITNITIHIKVQSSCQQANPNEIFHFVSNCFWDKTLIECIWRTVYRSDIQTQTFHVHLGGLHDFLVNNKLWECLMKGRWWVNKHWIVQQRSLEHTHICK